MFSWKGYFRLTHVERLSWTRDLWPESCRRCKVVAGVAAREHPPSSLKGVEQPSEATEKKKNSSCIYFSYWHYWTVKKQKNTQYYKKSNILIFTHVDGWLPQRQQLFCNCRPINECKESACNADQGSIPEWGRFPWRWEWLPIPVFLPGEFHGQRSLVGYSPWGQRVRHNWATNKMECHSNTNLE